MVTLEQNLSRQTVRILKGLLIGIGVVLVIIVVLATQKLRAIDRYEGYSTKVLVTHPFHVPATSEDIAYIEPWMTFAYVNHIFGLPNSYLQTTLHVTDSRYPQLVIGRYATMTKQSHEKVLLSVRAAVQIYVASTTASSTNP